VRGRLGPVLTWLALGWLVLAGPVLAQDLEAGRPVAQEALIRLLKVLGSAEKTELGLDGAEERNVSLSRPMIVYTLSRQDLVEADGRAWGGLFKETDEVFFPVRVSGQDRAGVWLRRKGRGFEVLSVGDARLAQAVAEARDKIGPALARQGLNDDYDLRLLVLDWAACRLLAVLVRDRLFIWPLPSAAELLELAPSLYRAEELRPKLTGRSPG